MGGGRLSPAARSRRRPSLGPSLLNTYPRPRVDIQRTPRVKLTHSIACNRGSFGFAPGITVHVDVFCQPFDP